VKVEAWLFGGGVFFFTPVAFIYGIVTGWDEPVGVVGILLTSGLALMIGFYMAVVGRRIDPRPEDDVYGEIHEGAGELGEFSPYSWWPFALSLGAATTFTGFAVGWWLFYIGAGVSAIALVGWVFEYYRGEHAH
jgi:hypothetical protein